MVEYSGVFVRSAACGQIGGVYSLLSETLWNPEAATACIVPFEFTLTGLFFVNGLAQLCADAACQGSPHPRNPCIGCNVVSDHAFVVVVLVQFPLKRAQTRRRQHAGLVLRRLKAAFYQGKRA